MDRHDDDGLADLTGLVDRVPDGWTRATYEGRTYGLSRTNRVDGRVVTITAAELGGTDLVSANVYRTRAGDELRSCEMPDAKVLSFLRGWTSE
ncbi:peptide methionine sulfoxide reductase [Microbacterium sp. 1.5R]|uniref:peptide methionine sulfoxide reductase n=1 Tax=Microbacterium sp. 1.5R TaxID=1916917 RepID=UPI0021B44977|nr:peptide methionine sulfoxide reductase [Microbacterium sp. 1.5R]